MYMYMWKVLVIRLSSRCYVIHICVYIHTYTFDIYTYTHMFVDDIHIMYIHMKNLPWWESLVKFTTSTYLNAYMCIHTHIQGWWTRTRQGTREAHAQ